MRRLTLGLAVKSARHLSTSRLTRGVGMASPSQWMAADSKAMTPYNPQLQRTMTGRRVRAFGAHDTRSRGR